VLLGNQGQSGLGHGIRPLVLFHVTDDPPALVVADADPQVEIEERAAGWTLVGYDLENHEVKAGGTLHLTLYWQTAEVSQRVLLGTMLDGTALETHEPGMGNLQRYLQECHPPKDGVLVEDYRVVVPRTTEAGTAELAIGVSLRFQPARGEAEWETVLHLGGITILPGE
jgi:hypothetical protein